VLDAVEERPHVDDLRGGLRHSRDGSHAGERRRHEQRPAAALALAERFQRSYPLTLASLALGLVLLRADDARGAAQGRAPGGGIVPALSCYEGALAIAGAGGLRPLEAHCHAGLARVRLSCALGETDELLLS
jgi:hypothetical protein